MFTRQKLMVSFLATGSFFCLETNIFANALVHIPLNEGKGNAVFVKGERELTGKLRGGAWVKGKKVERSKQIKFFDPFLSLYWPMDEGEGLYIYNKGPAGKNFLAGKIENCQWVEGKSGKALKFSQKDISRVKIVGSTSSYIQRSLIHSINFRYGLSFEFWMKLDSLEDQGIGAFINQAHTLKILGGKLVIENSEYPRNKKIFGKHKINRIDTDFSPKENRWYYVTFVNDFKSKKVVIYINGAAVKAMTYQKDIAYFGIRDWTICSLGVGFDGVLDELRIYSRPLDAQEIKAHLQWKERKSLFVESGIAKVEVKEAWALEFDGRDDHISIPGLSLKNEFTIEAWILATIPSLDSSILEQSRRNPPVGLRFGIQERRLLAAFSTGEGKPIPVAGARDIHSDNAVIWEGKWVHVALTYSLKQSESRLYLNGIEIQKVPIKEPVYYISSGNMTISGCSPFPTNHGQFQGFIKDIRIYNRPLSLKEIRKDYMEGLSLLSKFEFFTQEEKEKKRSSCLLKAKVVDKKTGNPLEANVYVKVNDRYYISKDHLYWGSFGSKAESVFIAVGEFKLMVPPGDVKIEITRGFEYLPYEDTFKLKDKDKEGKELIVEMERLVDMPSLGWYAGDHEMATWGHGKGKLFEKFASPYGWQYYADAGKAWGFNYLSHPAFFPDGDYKSTWTDRFISYPTAESQISSIHARYAGGDIVARMEQLIKAGGHGLVQRYGGDGLKPGQVATAMALDKIDAWVVAEKDWYKYLNMGFKCGVGVSSDYYFTYHMPHCFGKEYTRMPKLSWPNMVEAYKNHATFQTSGALVIFKINDREVGENVIVPGDKPEELKFSISGWHVYGLNKIELIRNGNIEKTFTYENKPKEVKENFGLKVDKTCWFLVKVFGEKGKFAGKGVRTAPIYIQFGNDPLEVKKEDIDHFIGHVQKYKKGLKKGMGQEKWLSNAEKAIDVYNSLLTKPRTWLDDKPVLEEPERPRVLEKDTSLILYYPFDEGRTDFAWDRSQNNHKASLFNCTWVEGKKGKAVELNKSSSSIRAGTITPEEGLSFTSWIKLKEKKSKIHFLFDVRSCNASVRFWIQGNEMMWTYSSPESRREHPSRASGNFPFKPDEWYHLAVTHDYVNKEIRLYVNGNCIGTRPSLRVIPVDGETLILGSKPRAGGKTFKGTLDEVKIYNRALSGEEVKREFEKLGRSGSDLQSLRRLN